MCKDGVENNEEIDLNEKLAKLREAMGAPPECVGCSQPMEVVRNKRGIQSWGCMNSDCQFFYLKPIVQSVEADCEETKSRRGRPLGSKNRTSREYPDIPGMPEIPNCPVAGCDGHVVFRITPNDGLLKLGCTNYYSNGKKSGKKCSYYVDIPGLDPVPVLIKRRDALCKARKKFEYKGYTLASCPICEGELLETRLFLDPIGNMFLLLLCENSIFLGGKCEVIFYQINFIPPDKSGGSSGEENP